MKKSFFSLAFFGLLLFALSSCEKDITTPETGVTEEENLELRSGYEPTGAVYVIDNDANTNHLLVFNRNADGSLGEYASFATGGAGNGGGLGSQGAVILHRQFVLVCNAGSNEISVFEKKGRRMSLTDKVNSKGISPTSVTAFGSLVYVLNAGGTGNISGFHLSPKGKLTHLGGSTRPLSSSAAAAAQVSFDKNGRILVVAERATNKLTTFPVNNKGIAGHGTAFSSAGQTPFGFDFAKNNTIIVSEAFGGAPNASTLSSYQIGGKGNVQLLDGPEPTKQTAACWVSITNDGRFAYTTNTGSNTVTGYSVRPNGKLTLLNANGITGSTGMGPIDADMTNNSRFLYITNGGSNSISIFRVNNNGSLTNLGEVTGLPEAVVGMAVE